MRAYAIPSTLFSGVQSYGIFMTHRKFSGEKLFFPSVFFRFDALAYLVDTKF